LERKLSLRSMTGSNKSGIESSRTQVDAKVWSEFWRGYEGAFVKLNEGEQPAIRTFNNTAFLNLRPIPVLKNLYTRIQYHDFLVAYLSSRAAHAGPKDNSKLVQFPLGNDLHFKADALRRTRMWGLNRSTGAIRN